MSCDDCVDRAYFANLFLSELLTGEGEVLPRT